MNVAANAYERAARARDSGRSFPVSPSLASQRAAQDVALRKMEKDLDASAQDHHMKSERFHFAVVGEGSRSALEAYRKGYDQINWDA